ncbi:MAG: DEAD/DEAH box helicase [Planctomycetota bacterium]|jgi:superfamily II DNA/RNA helicase
MPFSVMGLTDPLVQGILATGYNAPTEIQAQAIPAALEGKDIIGCAQTGTGKTAAFVLPILHKLEHSVKPKRRRVKSLILTPTRELAVQIEKAIVGYSRFLDVSTLAVYGGVPIQKQFKALRRGVDIVVATPGRLLDHANRGTVDLRQVEVLVLDEADRMLDMGFINDIKKIIADVPEDRQTLMFSATMTGDIKKLTATIQKDPVKIQIGKQHNPIETITQHIYPVSKEQKKDLLLHILETEDMDSVLVFSRTKRGADLICRDLKRADIVAASIHSDHTQKKRQKALDGFRSGKFQVLVATDIAARGINVEGISHVINYDVPGYAEDYVHRIGRTGRAMSTGDAITFVAQDEVHSLRKIERFIDQKLDAKNYPGFAYTKTVKLDRAPAAKKKKSKPGSSQRKRAQGKPGQKAGSDQSRPKSPGKKKTTFKKTARKSYGKDSGSEGAKPKRKSYGKKAGGDSSKSKRKSYDKDSRSEGQKSKYKPKHKSYKKDGGKDGGEEKKSGYKPFGKRKKATAKKKRKTVVFKGLKKKSEKPHKKRRD